MNVQYGLWMGVIRQGLAWCQDIEDLLVLAKGGAGEARKPSKGLMVKWGIQRHQWEDLAPNSSK